MADAEIHYKLDLVVRLVDTTTGNPIGQRQVTFRKDGQIVPFLLRDEGLYVLLNHGREDMNLMIQAAGFLPVRVRVCYEELSENFPEVEAAMIPESGRSGFIDLLTMKGHCPGLESIAAVSLKEVYGAVGSYQERKQILRLYHTKPLKEMSYAVIHEQQQEFEEFRIRKRLDKLSVKLEKPLVTAGRPEEKVARIVRGMVDENGNYLLRMREGGEGAEYLIRSVINGKASFQKLSAESLGTTDMTREGGTREWGFWQ